MVGGGPAGLEAARGLSERGADVILAEATGSWGGRVSDESQLPGLAEWARVRDWRLWQLKQKSNAALCLESPLTVEDILDYGIANIVLATGAKWRADGAGRYHRTPRPYLNNKRVLTPDDLMTHGTQMITSKSPVVVFDDDRFYLGSVLAELIANSGHKTIFVSPSPVVAPWAEHTLEQTRIQKRLIELGVEIIPLHGLSGMTDDELHLECVYSSQVKTIPCGTLVTVTSRLPNDSLWHGLKGVEDSWAEAGIKSVTRIGDCLAPGLIAAAVYSGHGYAREAGTTAPGDTLREDYGRIQRVEELPKTLFS